MTYDCLVVGAGPAGSSAAYHLARRGFSVFLADKAKLPRYKPCGGLVVGRVLVEGRELLALMRSGSGSDEEERS